MNYFKKKYMLIKNKFKNLSISIKLIFSFSLIICIIGALSLTDFIFYKNDKLQSTLNTVTQMNSESLHEIESYINDLKQLTKIPVSFDNSSLLAQLKNSSTNNTNSLSLNDKMQSMFTTILSLKEDISSVFVFNLNGDSYYKINGSDLYTDYFPCKELWFNETLKRFGAPYIIPSYSLKYIADRPNGLNYFFSISRSIVDYDTASNVGVITINSNINVLKKILSRLEIYNNQKIILIDKYKNIIYDNKECNISCPLVSIYPDLKLNNLHTKISNCNYIVKSTHSESTGWTIINLIPAVSLNHQITESKLKSSILTFLISILGLLLMILISKKIVDPIHILSKKMHLVEQGDFNVELSVDSKDEIGHLAESFNTMNKKLQSLINEVYVNKINQKELEIKMLENQINPHFLYNTLESIHMMAEINDDSETAEMAVSLGAILRYGLSKQIMTVTLNDEINNVKIYVNLQKNRFDNIDDIYFDIDDKYLKVKTIKLLLQPIVENSIYHGLNSKTTGGKINIKAYKKNNSLIIDCSDNGIGIDSVTLTKLNAYINGFNDDFNSIGLKNVNMRIQLHYGINYGLTVLSESGKYTLVRATLPLIF